MKYLEILEQTLTEINMSPSSLRQAAAGIDALAGMEFEMIIPGVGSDDEDDDDQEYEPDYDQDQRTRSFSDIRDFFDDGDYNSRRDADNLMEEIVAEYSEWKQEQIDESWDSEGEDYVRDYVANNDLFDRDEAMVEARDELINDLPPDLSQESEEFTRLLTARLDEMEREFAQAEYENQGRIYDDAFEEFTEEKQTEDAEREFLDEKYPYMTDLLNKFDIIWPHYYDINADSDNGATTDVEQVGDEFSSFMGKPVNTSDRYHGAKREDGHYVVEPDGSLEGDNRGDGGLEFVSPPMPVAEMLADLKKVKAWADKTGAYTNDSTGLHINVSVPGFSKEKLDYVKLAVLLGDERVLNEFGRMGNTYAKSALQIVKQNIQQRPADAEALLAKMKEHLSTAAAKIIHTGETSKFTSINAKTGYIEFRSPGGDWLDSNFSIIEPTLLRFVVAMDAALDETKYQKEYAKKLYKLLAPGSDEPGILELFANYSAGDLPKDALIRQVRQQQLARNVAKGKGPVGQQYWWNVQWDANRRIEVVASNKGVARQVAAEEWGVPVEQLAIAKVTMLRPYEPEPAAPQGNWGIWIANSDRFSRQPNTIVADNVLRRFPSQAAAMAFLERTREENPQMRADAEVREIPANYQSPTTPFSRPVGQASQQYEIFNQTTGQSLERFTASSPQDAAEFLNSYRSQGPHRLTPDEAARTFDARQITAARPSPSRSNYENPAIAAIMAGVLPLFYVNPVGRGGDQVAVRAQNWRDAISMAKKLGPDSLANLPATEIEVRSEYNGPIINSQSTQVAAATAPQTLTRPGQAQQRFTGEWKIVDADDRELHRFGGVEHQQRANSVAMSWLRQNPGRMQAGVTVVPVME